MHPAAAAATPLDGQSLQSGRAFHCTPRSLELPLRVLAPLVEAPLESLPKEPAIHAATRHLSIRLDVDPALESEERTDDPDLDIDAGVGRHGGQILHHPEPVDFELELDRLVVAEAARSEHAVAGLTQGSSSRLADQGFDRQRRIEDDVLRRATGLVRGATDGPRPQRKVLEVALE